jgi:hypothetical protein
MAESAGFWSYVQDDNDDEDDRILRLAERLRAEFALLTGDSLELFVDRKDISWGEEWRRRIDDALEATTFFIPIVTPRYFKRPECRRELLTFAGHAQSLGLEELLLPIHYADVAELGPDEEPSSDEAVALVAKTQWEDWRTLRLRDERTAEYRQGVNDLAKRLAEISAKTEAVPPTPTSEPEEAREEEPGFIDLVASGEEAMPRWTQTIQSLGEEMQNVSRLTEETAPELEASDARAGGFAGRLAVLRRFAARLQEPADRIDALATQYAADLVEIDPAILTLIRLAEEDEEARESDDVEEFFANLRTMVEASSEASDTVRQLVGQLEASMAASRDLRRPVRTMKDALKKLLDGQAVIEEWKRRLHQGPRADNG